MLWTHFEVEHLRDAYDQLIHSDMPYKNKIEVRSFYLTRDQLVKFLKNSKNLPIQKSLSQPKDQKHYGIICMKNRGDKQAWGYLGGIYITRGQLPPKMEEYAFSIFPIRGGRPKIQKKSESPSWVYLYTD